MKIAFAADPLAGFKIEKDSTYAMMVEAARRGHALYAFAHADLIFDGASVACQADRQSTRVVPSR
jgi:glutathione synthase